MPIPTLEVVRSWLPEGASIAGTRNQWQVFLPPNDRAAELFKRAFRQRFKLDIGGHKNRNHWVFQSLTLDGGSDHLTPGIPDYLGIKLASPAKVAFQFLASSLTHGFDWEDFDLESNPTLQRKILTRLRIRSPADIWADSSREGERDWEEENFGMGDRVGKTGLGHSVFFGQAAGRDAVMIDSNPVSILFSV